MRGRPSAQLIEVVVVVVVVAAVVVVVVAAVEVIVVVVVVVAVVVVVVVVLAAWLTLMCKRPEDGSYNPAPNLSVFRKISVFPAYLRTKNSVSDDVPPSLEPSSGL